MADYKELIERLNDISKSLGFESTSCVCLAAEAIERLVKERDAAIADLQKGADCEYCKHQNSERCIGCAYPSVKFEWRGAQEDNSEADDHG